MSKLSEFENEAKEIADSSLKCINNIQVPQPDGKTKPPAPAKGHKENTFAVKHSGYSFLTSGIIPCDKCLIKSECGQYEEDGSCEIIKNYQVKKIKEIMDLPYTRPEDITLAQMLARELAFQTVIAKYIAKSGLFRARKGLVLELQPVLKSYWTSVNAATRMCDQLGLSPIARAKLRVKEGGLDLAELMQQVEETEENDKKKQS